MATPSSWCWMRLTTLSTTACRRHFRRPAAALFSSNDESKTTDPSRPWLDGIRTPLTLIDKQRVSRDSNIYSFSLTAADTFGIPVCSCVLVSPTDETDIVRPYTPISSRHERGQVRLLVKIYPEGQMSVRFDRMVVGQDELLFWQIPFNLKEQYPFGKRKLIMMLAGGTGITPMYQAIQRMFGPDEEEPLEGTRVVLVYGSRTAEDVFLRDEMERIAERHRHCFRVVYVLSHEDDDAVFADSDWEKGFITQDLLERIFKEESDSLGILGEEEVSAWVCGPPVLYDLLSGPREEKDVLPKDSILSKMGFTPSQVIKF